MWPRALLLLWSATALAARCASEEHHRRTTIGHTIGVTAVSAGRRPCYLVECTGEAKHVGCFRDGAKARMMNAANTSSPTMTLDECVHFCTSGASRGKPFPFAGVEDGTQCFCGDEPPAPGRAGWQPASANHTGPWFCSHPSPTALCKADCYKAERNESVTELCCCAGNATQRCGSVGLLQVYDVSSVSCREERVAEPYCNPALPVEQRIDDLVGRLTAEEKVACLSTKTCAVPRLAVAMSWGEALHGLRFPCITDLPSQATPLCATSFPHAQLLAATFNASLWRAVGTAIATEARAFYNLYSSGRSSTSRFALSFFAPDINLCRDPRWGRCLEVPGEDPVLSGEYAVGYVGGMQQGLSTRANTTLSMSVCNAKHWSAYDVEKGATNDGTGDPYNRGSFDATVPLQDLIESYWPAFKAAVHGAGMGGVMCSYNAVNNVPSCANGVFNNEVLRGAFGFDGMVVSDCGAVVGITASHNYTHTPGDTVRAALRGGTDLDCGNYYTANIAKAQASGAVDDDDVNRALCRVLGQFYRVGLGEDPVPWSSLDEASIDTPASRAAALDAAVQGMVLLRNEGGLLPLRPKHPGGRVRVAVVGPHLNSSTQLLANYYGDNVVVQSQTPLLGLERRRDVDVVGAVEGCDLFNVSLPPDLDGAAALARKADVAVVFLGLHSTQGPQVSNGPGMEREGYDRTDLTLPGHQPALIEAVVATGTPTVVVFINSGGLAAEWVYSNVPAVFEAYYPGEMGGDAIASVLLGDVSPSGRLTTTVYPADYVFKRNITDMQFRPHGAVPGITYRFLNDNDTLFPFGFGATYTTFRFAFERGVPVTVATSDVCSGGRGARGGRLATVTVTASNTGAVASDVSVLCFVHSLNATRSAPRQLAGFGRARRVQPGFTAAVEVELLVAALQHTDASGASFSSPAVFELQCGGEPDGFAQSALTVQGTRCPIFAYPPHSTQRSAPRVVV